MLIYLLLSNFDYHNLLITSTSWINLAKNQLFLFSKFVSRRVCSIIHKYNIFCIEMDLFSEEMDSLEIVLVSPEQDKKVSSIFSDFMAEITKLEEMGSLASNFLVGFHQHLEFLPRPSVVKTSQVVDNIIKANETERMKAYVQAGCKNVHDGIQSISKLNVSQRGLQDHLSKAKDVLDELKLLMEDAVACVQTANESTVWCQDEHICDDSLRQNEEMQSALVKPEFSDYAAMMAIIYNMVTQDYSMQEKIVCSLNLNSPSEELESYCLMWSLRPFINDEVMQHAWSLIS